MTDAPFADELGCTEVYSLLENFVQCELRNAAEYQRMVNDDLEPRPYMDATLASKRKHYVKFVRDLAERGLMPGAFLRKSSARSSSSRKKMEG